MVSWGTDTGEIWSFEERTDENGEKWYVINQDTHYPMSQWTEEEARADYSSEESIRERYNDLYRAWCD